MEPKKSIILVTVDCLRADHTGFMGYQRRTTPFLDSLAVESFVFPAAIAAGAPTYYSLPSILASRYPLALGRDVLGIAPQETTITTVLRKAGYATAAFTAGNPYLSPQFGYDQGFDQFRDFCADQSLPSNPHKNVEPQRLSTGLNQKLKEVASRWGPLEMIYDELYFRYCQKRSPVPDSLNGLRPYPSADVIVDHACRWLGGLKGEPFFLWLHLMDPHWPYYPPDEAIEWMSGTQLSNYDKRYLNSFWNRSDLGQSRLAKRRHEVIALYDAGIRWADKQISRLVAELKNSGQWKDCIFALTADHGEEFLEHGQRFHSPGVSEELLHVPLLLRAPGSEEGQPGKSPFSLLNLAPTLLDAAGVACPVEFHGRSRWKAIRRREESDEIAIAECVVGCTNPLRPENRLGSRVLAVRDSRFKLVLHFDPAKEQLFDLDADPGERTELDTSAHSSERKRLLQVARDHLLHSSSRVDQAGRVRARLHEHLKRQSA